ncbi:hypothetical protein BV22DRAFT_979713, partial [Leucogyrophana mollusca]
RKPKPIRKINKATGKESTYETDFSNNNCSAATMGYIATAKNLSDKTLADIVSKVEKYLKPTSSEPLTSDTTSGEPEAR